MFAYGPADAAASKTPSSLTSFNSRLVSHFWYRLNDNDNEREFIQHIVINKSRTR